MARYPLITSAPDHYDRHRQKRILALEVISPATFASDRNHSKTHHFKVLNRNGHAMDARRNGNTKTWKRSPRIEVPATVGFQEHFRLISTDGHTWDEDIPYRVLSASSDIHHGFDKCNCDDSTPRPLIAWHCEVCNEDKTAMHGNPDSGICLDCYEAQQAEKRGDL